MWHKNQIPVLWLATAWTTDAFQSSQCYEHFHNISVLHSRKKIFSEPGFVKKNAVSLLCFMFAIIWNLSIQFRLTVVRRIRFECSLTVSLTNATSMPLLNLFSKYNIKVVSNSFLSFSLLQSHSLPSSQLPKLQRLKGYIHTQWDNYEYMTESKAFVWANRKIM